MLKRLFDILVSAIGIIIFLPVLLIVACLVRYKLGSPVFFRQDRPGLGGTAFQLIKFRSMTDTYHDQLMLETDAQRITPFGRKLRASSLDELPELWNVLKGEMSLVGPRPLLMEYLPLYTKEQARRHEVRPGITGWAQINGRNALSWEEKFTLDTWYVDNRTFLLDMKIILITLKRVVLREGIHQEGNVTMEKFTGSERSDLRP